MTNLLEEILNNHKQEKANKIAIERQKEKEKQMFLDAWDQLYNGAIETSMKLFGEQLRNHYHYLSYQKKSPSGYTKTEHSWTITLCDNHLSCCLWFACSEPDRKVVIIRQYAYKYRGTKNRAPLPPSIPTQPIETRHQITDITPEFLELLVAESLKLMLETNS